MYGENEIPADAMGGEMEAAMDAEMDAEMNGGSMDDMDGMESPEPAAAGSEGQNG